MNQRNDEKLLQYYCQFHQDHDRLRDELISDLMPSEVRKRPPISLEYRRYIMRSSIGLAASVMIGLSFWFTLFSNSQQPLYAQVVAAIKKINLMNHESQQFRDGELSSVQKSWYQRGVGYVEHEIIAGQRYTTLDDGQHTWSYASDGQLVAKFKSYRDVNDPSSYNLDKLFFSRFLRLNPVRAPEGDKMVSGEMCRHYTVDQEGQKGSCWIGSDDLLRAYEVYKPDNVDEYFGGNVDYDTAIDPHVFKPELPKNAKVVDPRIYIGEQFDIDSAIFEKESVGLLFTVHKLERLNEKWAFMVSSTRLTDSSGTQLNIDHPWQFLGGANLQYRGDGFNDGKPTCFPMQVAEMKVGDLIVKWHLVSIRNHDRLERCSLLVLANASNELAELIGSVKPASDRFELDLPVPSEPISEKLDEVLASIHSKGRRMSPIVHWFQLFEDVPLTVGQTDKPDVRQRDPRHLSERDFIASVERRIEQYTSAP